MLKPSTNDKAKGKLHEIKGAIKEKAGQIANNTELETKGNAEKNAGKVQNWIGRVEKAVGE